MNTITTSKLQKQANELFLNFPLPCDGKLYIQTASYMRRSERNIPRIDYKEFHTRGVKSFKQNQPTCEVSIKMNSVQQLKIEEAVLREDIGDLIDENEVTNLNLNELDINIEKIEQLRTVFRSKHHELKHYLGDDYQISHEKLYDETLVKIKSYIKDSKDCKAKDKLVETEALRIAEAQRDNSTLFKIEETLRNINLLESEFMKDVKEEDDEILVTLNKELPNNIKKFERIAEKYEEMLVVVSSCPDVSRGIADVGKRYSRLTLCKDRFSHTLKNEISIRELNKHELFKEARLNIKLSKFSGYDSYTDIYSFQSEFEKLYSRTTPKRFAADLLKNNFLSEPALSLVRGVDDIREIWRRLKTAYGDTQMLLNKKLNQISKCESLSKTRDPEKLICELSKLINIMKDLLGLAKQHKIERYLFYGDALNRIYKLMGDHRVTRWFDNAYDETFEKKEEWANLILFLEKEVRVQQQKILVQSGKVENKEKNVIDKPARYKNYHSSNSAANEENLLCHICGEASANSEHVATAGPGGSKVIQYFSCKVFVEKTPAERLAILRNKGYCIQCLLPGASGSQGKHKDGKCQHDFVCKHTAHQRYPSKKHVLVCDEHKHLDENKELLENYKARCISKNENLPTFSKEIKLSFSSKYCY